MSEFITGFLGILAGGGVLVGLLVFFGDKFVGHQLEKALAEHQHGLNEKLAAIGANILRVNDLLGRRNEREFKVVAGAWKRMIKAVGTAQGEFGTGHGTISFRMTPEEQAIDLINRLPLHETQKVAMRAASGAERDDLYSKFILAYSVYLVNNDYADFANWLSMRQIFFSENIYQGFYRLRNRLLDVLVRARAYSEMNMALPTQEEAAIGRMLRNDVNNEIESFARVIRAKFGFDSESAAVPVAKPQA